MECAFCHTEEIQPRTIAEDEFAFAFPTRTPIVPGHILISPKRHVQYYEDATLSERNAIENLRVKIKKALKQAFNAEGFNYAWNEEEIGGQSVPHLHLHVIPRKTGDSGVYQYEPREFLYRPGPRTAVTPQEELAEVARLLKHEITTVGNTYD